MQINNVNVSKATSLIITQCCKQKDPGHMYNIRITKMLAKRVHRRRFPSGFSHDLPVEGLLLRSEEWIIRGACNIRSLEIDGIQTKFISHYLIQVSKKSMCCMGVQTSVTHHVWCCEP